MPIDLITVNYIKLQLWRRRVVKVKLHNLQRIRNKNDGDKVEYREDGEEGNNKDKLEEEKDEKK